MCERSILSCQNLRAVASITINSVQSMLNCSFKIELSARTGEFRQAQLFIRSAILVKLLVWDILSRLSVWWAKIKPNYITVLSGPSVTRLSGVFTGFWCQFYWFSFCLVTFSSILMSALFIHTFHFKQVHMGMHLEHVKWTV